VSELREAKNYAKALRNLLRTSEENERLQQLQNKTLMVEIEEARRALNRDENNDTNLLYIKNALVSYLEAEEPIVSSLLNDWLFFFPDFSSSSSSFS
jgi:hypothetical protein